MNVDSEHARKALVAFVIERALLKISASVLDEVSSNLYEEHHCHLGDCYEHPEYLSEILGGLYGNTYNVIIEEIKKELEEFSYQKPIENFLKAIAV